MVSSFSWIKKGKSIQSILSQLQLIKIKIMVFGYYHISTKTLDQTEAASLGCPPNGRISHKVKVGHMLWIPFLPLDNYWVMEAAGQTYMMNYQVSNRLTAKHGKSETPWYAFLGFIAIPIIFGLISISGKVSKTNRDNRNQKRHTEMVTTRHAAIDNAKETDYYQFKINNYKKVVLKVDEISKDSIQFQTPIDNDQKKWGQKYWAVGFYSGDSPTEVTSFAKSDLKSSFNNILYSKEGTVPLTSSKSPWLEKLTLDKITHMENVSTDNSSMDIPIVSDLEDRKIKTSLQRIIDNLGNTDSLVSNMDKESHEYYKNMLENALKKDVDAANYVNKTSNNVGKLETMLYTKYMYLDSGDNQEKDIDNITRNTKDLKGYLFFLSLMERSFLTIDTEIADKIKIKEVSVPSQNNAVITLSAPSNILKRQKTVNYSVIMHKEDGQWKINVPSTYSYTTAQIFDAAGFNNRRAYSKQFKEVIITEIEKLNDGKPVHESFKR